MLLQSIDPLPGRLVGHKAVVIDGIDVPLFAHHVAKAAARRVLEADAPRLVSEDPLDIVPVVQLVVEPLRNLNLARRISVLDDDQVIWLERVKEYASERQSGNREAASYMTLACHAKRSCVPGRNPSIAPGSQGSELQAIARGEQVRVRTRRGGRQRKVAQIERRIKTCWSE